MATPDPANLDNIISAAASIRDCGERRAFIDRACGADQALRERIAAMVEDRTLQATAARTLDPGETVDMASPGTAAPIHEGPGSTIGRYRIIRELGAGGFGVVFLAEQQEPVRREVALKIIKLGMDTRQVIARFEIERQALAMMDHPHIARVLDAGATKTGRPYFAMELVRGVPLTQYCDEQRLNTRQRLDLFGDVCRAVQHAHHKGVIHRDLKPSNVMVTVQDNQPTVKVIDFGIAKATDQHLAEHTLFTQQGQLVGTPAYMSPEQADPRCKDIDARTDIYSLGVVLYELLTGSTPFDRTRLLSAGAAEIQRIIVEQDPQRPSTRVRSVPLTAAQLGQPGTVTTTSSTIAALRRTDPGGLTRQLRGDLDWIIMKALEKDRDRRYETANAFAMDIQRYLTSQPVLASPPSAIYLFRKFAHRNRPLIMTTVAVSLALCVALGALVVSYVGIRKERDAKELARKGEAAQRLKAEQARDASEAVTRFLANMLGSADPGSQGKDVTVREVLDHAARHIGQQFENKPFIEARLRSTIGNTYRALGLNQAAEPHVSTSLELLEGLVGRQHVNTRQAVRDLGILYWHQGRYEEARVLLRDLLDELATLDDVKSSEQADVLNCLGIVLLDMHRLDEANALFSDSLVLCKDADPQDRSGMCQALTNLALVASQQNRLQDAEQLHRESLELRREMQGPEHPQTLSNMNNLANVYLKMGRYPDAEELMTRTLDIRQRVLGEAHPQTLDSMVNLGHLFRKMGREHDALTLHEQAWATSREINGVEHPATLHAKNNVAIGYDDAGRLADAEPLYEELVEENRAVHGPDHPGTLRAVYNLALLWMSQNQYPKARPGLDEALVLSERIHGADHPMTVDVHSSRIDLLRRMRAYSEAIPQFDHVLSLHRSAYGDDHPKTLTFMGLMAEVYVKSGDFDQAEPLFKRIVERREVLHGPDHPMTINAVHGLAYFYELADQPQRCLPLLTRVVDSLERKARSPDARPADLFAYGRLILLVEQPELQDLKTSLEFVLEANKRTDFKNYEYVDFLAEAYHRNGEWMKGTQYRMQAAALLVKQTGIVDGQ